METYIPLLCLVALLFFSVLGRRSSARPSVWTWRMAAAVLLVALGAVAIPFLVAAILNS